MTFLNAKRLYPELGSAVTFSSKIIHREAPYQKKLSEINYKQGVYEAETQKFYKIFNLLSFWKCRWNRLLHVR